MRRVWVTREVQWLRDRREWAGLRNVVRVEHQRQLLAPAHPGNVRKIEWEQRHFISSLDHRDGDAAYFGRHIREHWHIEIKLHWSLDMSFAEDSSLVWQGHAQENFSRRRWIGLNLQNGRKPANAASGPNTLRPAGTTTTCSNSSAWRLRCDYPSGCGSKIL